MLGFATASERSGQRVRDPCHYDISSPGTLFVWLLGVGSASDGLIKFNHVA